MILKNAQVVLYDKITENSSLYIEDGTIIGMDSPSLDSGREETIDLEGKLVLPGFIDLHIHGIEGRDLMNTSPEEIHSLGESLLRHGVTSYLPTLLTESRENITSALDTIKTAMTDNHSGCRILGVHMEGPFFSHHYKGAQNPAFLLKGTIKNYEEIFSRYEEIIKIFSLAPEVCDDSLIAALTGRGIIPAAAHTGSTWEETVSAIDQGLSHSVHTFNGMKPLHHREPSCVGAVLTDDRVYCEVIFDGIHIHPGIFKLTLLCKGAERVILVSDSIDAAGLGDGSYTLGGQEVTVSGGVARTASGSLAGSTLTLHKAFKNAVKLGGLSVCEASRLASTNPARHLELEQLGEIRRGYKADLVILHENLEIYGVVSRGVLRRF